MNSRHGSLENIILNAIWSFHEDGGELVSVLDIQNKINASNNQNWAYTTVKTVLDRLTEKGIINRHKQGKKYFYKSLDSRLFMGKKSIKRVLSQYYNDNIEELEQAVKEVKQEEFVLA